MPTIDIVELSIVESKTKREQSKEASLQAVDKHLALSTHSLFDLDKLSE